jgi:hypothetical protein
MCLSDLVRRLQKGCIKQRENRMYKTSPEQNIHQFVTTGLQLDGYRVVKNFGIVRGIIVRSRSIFGNIGAAFQQLVGGDITL